VFSAVGAFLPRIPGPRVVESIGFFFLKLPFLPLIAGVTFEIQRFFARYCTTGPLRSCSGPASSCRRSPPPSPTTISSRSPSRRCAPRSGARGPRRARAQRTFAGYGELLADPGYARSPSLARS
jgi:hypothetical protein